MQKRILLVDDESHILRAAEFKFQRAGFAVTCALDGEEAWQCILAQTPDIVVTDYQMPRVDGLELIERMRAHPATAQTPVLMLTAKGFEISRQQLCDQYKIDYVMMKPFSPRELLRRVEQAIAAASTDPVESYETAD